MNPKSIEAGRQKIDSFKKAALSVFTTALRAPLMLMMGCGYVNFGGRSHELHDYGESLTVVNANRFYNSEPYSETTHGPITDFVKVGEQVPGQLNSKQGKAPIHRHEDSDGMNGAYKYKYE